MTFSEAEDMSTAIFKPPPRSPCRRAVLPRGAGVCVCVCASYATAWDISERMMEVWGVDKECGFHM